MGAVSSIAADLHLTDGISHIPAQEDGGQAGKILPPRIGEVNSQMVFEQGRRHLSLYDTPYGSLSVGVSTRKMHAELGLSGGSIEIDYAIEIDHAVAGQNLFQINVREKRPILQQ